MGGGQGGEERGSTSGGSWPGQSCSPQSQPPHMFTLPPPLGMSQLHLATPAASQAASHSARVCTYSAMRQPVAQEGFSKELRSGLLQHSKWPSLAGVAMHWSTQAEKLPAGLGNDMASRIVKGASHRGSGWGARKGAIGVANRETTGKRNPWPASSAGQGRRGAG